MSKNQLFWVKNSDGDSGIKCDCGNAEYLNPETIAKGTSYQKFHSYSLSTKESQKSGAACKSCDGNWMIISN